MKMLKVILDFLGWKGRENWRREMRKENKENVKKKQWWYLFIIYFVFWGGTWLGKENKRRREIV